MQLPNVIVVVFGGSALINKIKPIITTKARAQTINKFNRARSAISMFINYTQ